MKTIIIDGVEYNLTPKALFKKGDWITTVDDEGGIAIEKVVEFWGNEVRLIDTDGVYTLCPQSWLNHYHLWTIQDAKVGDVLYHKSQLTGIEYIVMSKGVNGYGTVDSYFRYNSEDGFDINIPSVFSAKLDDITPATKEQRNLLFQKMKEAGYEWDAEKKELKKTEQKPSWSEEDEKMLDSIIDCLDGLCFIDSDQLNWLKSLKPRWKPTKEQLNSLGRFIEGVYGCIDFQNIKSLYNDLKKL